MMALVPRMLRLFGLPLICLAFFGLSGGHWAVFQTIAWGQMIRDYSKTGTIAEAIAKTFNGRSACGMCTKISKERQKENSAPATVKFDKKGEIFLMSIRHHLQRPGIKDYRYFDLDNATPTKRSQAPPAPVPRLS